MKKFLSIALTMAAVSVAMISCKEKDEDMTLNPVVRFEYSVAWGDDENGYWVDFANRSHNACTFEWSFGDGCTAKYSDTNFETLGGSTTISMHKAGEAANKFGVLHYYAKPGTYDVELIGENSMFFRNKATMVIRVAGSDDSGNSDNTDNTDDTENTEPQQ